MNCRNRNRIESDHSQTFIIQNSIFNIHDLLCRAGMARFQIDCDVFTNLLNSPADEQVLWNFDSREPGWIDSSLNRIFLVNVQAHRPVWKADRIECIVVSHLSGFFGLSGLSGSFGLFG
jgi:hypothetical protein